MARQQPESTPLAALTDPQAKTSAVAAFFDVDNTIIQGASIFHLAKGMRQRGLISTAKLGQFAHQQIRYLLLGENKSHIDQVRREALSIVAGIDPAVIRECGEEVYDEILRHKIWPGTHALIEQHLERGHHVWLVTAAPSEVASVIAERLGLTGALATRAEVINGVYSGALVGDLVHGSAKAEVIRELATQQGYDLAQCSAYGDSSNDIDMLSVVGRPSAVNPDRKLRRHAAKAHWRVIDYRSHRLLGKRGIQAVSAIAAMWMLRRTYSWFRG